MKQLTALIQSRFLVNKPFFDRNGIQQVLLVSTFLSDCAFLIINQSIKYTKA